MDGVTQSPPSDDWGLKRIDNWKLKFCWTPARCHLTNKSLWGKRAYHGIHYTGVSNSEYWVDRDEFILWSLKK